MPPKITAFTKKGPQAGPFSNAPPVDEAFQRLAKVRAQGEEQADACHEEADKIRAQAARDVTPQPKR